MDIYERLKKDHVRQRDLASRIMDTSGDSKDRRELFAKFREEVDSHADAEEQTFYAALIEKPDGQEKARHSISEHKEAADLLEELDELDMGSGGWIHKFEKLKHEIVHHLDEEEKEVFPLAKKLIADDKAKALAEAFDKRKTAEKKNH